MEKLNLVDPQIIAACITALATVMIGIFLIWLGRKQLKTDERKVKLDLYEKRWRIYVETSNLLDGLTSDNLNYSKVDELMGEYNNYSREAVFLFKKDLADYISEILTITFMYLIEELSFLQPYVSELQGLEKLRSAINTEGWILPSDFSDWASQKAKQLNEMFDEYLDFRNVK